MTYMSGTAFGVLFLTTNNKDSHRASESVQFTNWNGRLET
jgi:hypothetical protein